MVTYEQLVRHYLHALRHWERHPAVRQLCEPIGLSRRLYAELMASRRLDASAWTTGSGLSGNAAYDDALARLAVREHVTSPREGAGPHGQLASDRTERVATKLRRRTRGAEGVVTARRLEGARG